jgi:hypothetical protein
MLKLKAQQNVLKEYLKISKALFQEKQHVENDLIETPGPGYSQICEFLRRRQKHY